MTLDQTIHKDILKTYKLVIKEYLFKCIISKHKWYIKTYFIFKLVFNKTHTVYENSRQRLKLIKIWQISLSMVNLFDHKSCRYLSIDRMFTWIKTHFAMGKTFLSTSNNSWCFFSLVFMISVDLYPSIILQSKLKWIKSIYICKKHYMFKAK